MEAFEPRALDCAPLKPSVFRWYVDNTFIVWLHGREKLVEFIAFMNSLHGNIKFTMEVENMGMLPKQDGSLGHWVYQKPTHTYLYLNANSALHPTQKNTILFTLVLQARAISDEASLSDKLQHLHDVSKH